MSRPQSLAAALPGLRQMFAHLRPYLWRERRLVLGGLAALAAEIGLRLLEPWPLKFVVDDIITPALTPGATFSPPLGVWPAGVWLLLAALAVVVVNGLRALFVYLGTVSFAVAGHRTGTTLRGRVYSHLQALSLGFHTRARSGDLTLRVMSDVGVVTDVGLTALVPLVASTVVMFGMAGVMVWLNWKLALAALGLLPVFWLFALRTGRRLKEVARKQRRREGAMAATAAESIGAIKTVRALSLESAFASAFAGQNAKGLRDGAKASRLSARLERGVDALIAVATAAVMWYGATLVLGGEITTGELLVFLAYLKNAFKPLQDVAKYTARLAKASAAGERIVALLDEQPDVRDQPGAIVAPAFRGAVELSNVCFRYDGGPVVLNGVSLDIAAGTHVALVGPSGGGKSTLVNMLLRLHDPESGVVRIDGHDLRSLTVESVRRQISVVLQETLLFAGSIRDNIGFGAPEAGAGAVEQAARLASAHGFILATPDGYDTPVGERGVTLSGGQRQRLAIARAAVRQSPILILDEPTVGLDEENSQAVVDAILRIAAGRTVLSITHNLRFAARADRIVYIDAGRVVEDGTHRALVAQDGAYARSYRAQEAAGRAGAPVIAADVAFA